VTKHHPTGAETRQIRLLAILESLYQLIARVELLGAIHSSGRPTMRSAEEAST